jgi:hypothetical protein
VEALPEHLLRKRIKKRPGLYRTVFQVEAARTMRNVRSPTVKTPALKSGGPEYDPRVRLHAIAFTTFTPPAPLDGHPLV